MAVNLEVDLQDPRTSRTTPPTSTSTPRTLPVIAPNGKERGVKPDKFEDPKKYLSFQLALTLFLAQNNAIYPTEGDKILFTLTLMTDGLPGQWVRNWIMMQRSTRLPGYGMWIVFQEELDKQFINQL
jgi:hypothetical protein